MANLTTKYLDLTGLTSFWGKIKSYVDSQDAKLWDAAKTKIDTDDAAVRSYIESLTINNIGLTSDKTADTEGTTLSVTITAGDINVAYNGEGTPTDEQGHPILTTVTIQDAIDSIDTRLDDVQSELEEGVVSGLIVDATHGEYAEATKAWVDVTEVGTNNNGTDDVYQTGDIKIVVDDTAINDKFKEIDGEIAELEANAGVTNITVVDKNSDNYTGTDEETGEVKKGFIEISLEATKAKIFGEKPADMSEEAWTEYKKKFGDKSRGDIVITLDETVLDDKIDEIVTKVNDEIADRQADSLLLAGDGAEIVADKDSDDYGKLVWKTDEATGEAIVSYQNISAISARLGEIDENLVTKIEEGEDSKENYVSFTVTSTDVETAGDKDKGDKSITLTIDDSSLTDYISTNENNLTKLADKDNVLKVNGQTLITVTPGTIDAETGKVTKQVEVVGSSITLTTENINRTKVDGNGDPILLEEQLEEYDDKISALASATHFRGVTTDSITDGGNEVIKIEGETSNLEPEDGDIVIRMNNDEDEGRSREYIWSNGKWYELGDTTAEAARLDKVETWIDTKFIQTSDIEALFTGLFTEEAEPKEAPEFE